MGYEHFFVAPDGTEPAVIICEELRTLRDDLRGDDAADIMAGDRALAESDVRYPAAALANLNHVAQAAISRLERTGEKRFQPLGRRITRRATARALNVPLAALEPLGD